MPYAATTVCADGPKAENDKSASSTVKKVRFALDGVGKKAATPRKYASIKDDPKLVATLTNPDYWANIVKTAVKKAFEDYRADDTNETNESNDDDQSLDTHGSIFESIDSSLVFSPSKLETFACAGSAERRADDHELAHLGA